MLIEILKIPAKYPGQLPETALLNQYISVTYACTQLEYWEGHARSVRTSLCLRNNCQSLTGDVSSLILNRELSQRLRAC